MGLFVRGGTPKRHGHFFLLKEALGRTGCAVCRLSLAAVSRHLDSLAYESANEVETRARLRASRAFCGYHSGELLAGSSNAMGIAVIYADILTEVAELLEAGARGMGARGRNGDGMGSSLAQRILPQQSCPACETLADAEKRYLLTLMVHLREEDFAAAFASSSGLCAPHLGRALSLAKSSDEVNTLLAPVARIISGEPELTGLSMPGRPIPAYPSLPEPSDPAELLVGARGAQIIPAYLSESRGGELPATEDRAKEYPPGSGICQACGVALASDDALLAQLLDEEQSELTALCGHHAWRLREAGGEAALGTLRRSAEARMGELASTAPMPRRPKPGFLDRLGIRGRQPAEEGAGARLSCSVHDARRRAEWGWALAFASGGEDEVVTALSDPAYICLPHLSLALEASPPPQARMIALLAAKRIRLLVGELNEYVRKQDYRFSYEPRGSDADSPWRAVALAVGAEDLLGVGEMWWKRQRP